MILYIANRSFFARQKIRRKKSRGQKKHARAAKTQPPWARGAPGVRQTAAQMYFLWDTRVFGCQTATPSRRRPRIHWRVHAGSRAPIPATVYAPSPRSCACARTRAWARPGACLCACEFVLRRCVGHGDARDSSSHGSWCLQEALGHRGVYTRRFLTPSIVAVSGMSSPGRGWPPWVCLRCVARVHA